jgi:hypothetical protein
MLDNTLPQEMTVEVFPEIPVDEPTTARVLRLPSGKTYRVNEDLTGKDYFDFQRVMIAATQSGKRPEGAVDALLSLACKMFIIDEQPVTINTFDKLSFRDTSFISGELGKLLPDSQADKT